MKTLRTTVLVALTLTFGGCGKKEPVDMWMDSGLSSSTTTSTTDTTSGSDSSSSTTTSDSDSDSDSSTTTSDSDSDSDSTTSTTDTTSGSDSSSSTTTSDSDSDSDSSTTTSDSDSDSDSSTTTGNNNQQPEMGWYAECLDVEYSCAEDGLFNFMASNGQDTWCFCSSLCAEDSDCPAPEGKVAVCVEVQGGSLCALQCEPEGECYDGMDCLPAIPEVSICL